MNPENAEKIRGSDEKVMAGEAQRPDHRRGLLNAPNITPLRPITSGYDYVWHDWMLGPLIELFVFLAHTL